MTSGFLYSSLLSSYKQIKHGFGTWKSAPPENLIMAKQVHSSDVIIVGEPVLQAKKTGDALVTNIPNISLGVSTADCVPLLLYDPLHHIVGAVHIGWRGAVKGIIRNTIETLDKKFGVSPQDILIAIGPTIAPCCYKVGKDVHSAFRKSFPWWRKAFKSLPRTGKFMIDLPLSVELELKAMGAKPGNIERINMCTSCFLQFHSYRRDGKGCGRQVSYICIDKRSASSIIKI